MRVIFGGLVEEVLAVCQVVLRRAGSCSERRLNTLGIGHLECAIHLIGRDVIEALALVFLRERLPVEFSGLKKGERTHDVGASEGERILDGAVHVTLGRKVDDAINLLVLHQLVEGIEVADVHLDELVVRLVLDVLEVSEVAGISQLVEVDDVVLGVFVHEEAHYVRANETGTTGDNYIFHIFHLYYLSRKVSESTSCFFSSITLSRY